jgi:hypothetical protein
MSVGLAFSSAVDLICSVDFVQALEVAISGDVVRDVDVFGCQDADVTIVGLQFGASHEDLALLNPSCIQATCG